MIKKQALLKKYVLLLLELKNIYIFDEKHNEQDIHRKAHCYIKLYFPDIETRKKIKLFCLEKLQNEIDIWELKFATSKYQRLDNQISTLIYLVVYTQFKSVFMTEATSSVRFCCFCQFVLL